MSGKVKKDYEYEVVCRNLKTGEVFSQYFTGEYPARNFVRKCKFSKKIRVLCVDNIYGRDFDYTEV